MVAVNGRGKKESYALQTRNSNVNKGKKIKCLRNINFLVGKDLRRIKNYKALQDGNQPKQLLTNAFLEQKMDYIHRNPIEAEIVDEPGHYLYSSARDYAGEKG